MRFDGLLPAHWRPHFFLLSDKLIAAFSKPATHCLHAARTQEQQLRICFIQAMVADYSVDVPPRVFSTNYEATLIIMKKIASQPTGCWRLRSWPVALLPYADKMDPAPEPAFNSACSRHNSRLPASKRPQAGATHFWSSLGFEKSPALASCLVPGRKAEGRGISPAPHSGCPVKQCKPKAACPSKPYWGSIAAQYEANVTFCPSIYKTQNSSQLTASRVLLRPSLQNRLDAYWHFHGGEVGHGDRSFFPPLHFLKMARMDVSSSGKKVLESRHSDDRA
jgi:hypothetical protein